MHSGSAIFLVVIVIIATLIVQAALRARAQRLRPTVQEPGPNEIISAIRKAPVLEQPRAAKAYVGLNVRWHVTFESAFPTGMTTLRLMCQDRGGFSFSWVLFDVRKRKYPELNALVQHTPLWVTGQISQIKGDEIFLKHVALDFKSSDFKSFE